MLIYVADEHWNAGRGHRMRFLALQEALAERGVRVERSDDPQRGFAASLNAAGQVVIDDLPRHPLSFAPLRRCILAMRPKQMRDDPPDVRFICYPSTTALEMICIGFRVSLLMPRNDGEEKLMLAMAGFPDDVLFTLIDGRGADRVAEILCRTS